MTTRNVRTMFEKGITMRASLLAVLGLAALIGCTEPVKPPPPPSPAPTIVSFTASERRVKEGTQVTLSWETKDAVKIELREVSQGVLSADGLSGNTPVTVNADSLFVLVAENDRGVRDSAAVSVRLEEGPRGIIFAASPSRVSAGQPVELSWSVTGGQTVAIVPEGGSALDLEGQVDTGAITVHPITNTRYILQVDGAAAAEAAVEVRPTIDLFVPQPTSARPGEALSIAWKVTGATKVTLSTPGVGVLATETDPAKIADGLFETVATESVPHGGVHAFILRAEGATAELVTTETLEVYVSGTPKVIASNAPVYVTEGTQFTITWTTAGADWVEVLKDGVSIHHSPDRASTDMGTLTIDAPEQAATYTVVAVEGRGGRDEGNPMIVEPVGVPQVVTFDVSPQPGITNGGDPVTLTWDVPNARNLRIIAVDQYQVVSVTGVSAATGSMVTYPNKDTQYILTADNGVGVEVPAEARQVTVANPAKLTFTPSAMPVGAPVTITGTTIPNSGMITGLPHVVKNDPAASFIDISTTGFQIKSPAGYDPYSLPNGASFTMPYFGEIVTFDKLVIAEYGAMILGGTGSVSTSNQPFPTTALQPYAIAPLWDDLNDDDTSVNSRIFIQVDSQRLIVQWDELTHNTDDLTVTYQVQLYADGRIIFAYGDLLSQTLSPSIGLVNKDETEFSYVNEVPSSGDTYTFFAPLTPPVIMKARQEPFTVRVQIPPDSFIEIETTLPVIPPGQFAISEVNYNPVAGQTEWFEVTNYTNQAVDLNGWEIDFGGGSVYPLAGTPPLPANGTLVFGQTSTSTEGVSNVDVVYGTSYSLPDAAGSISLSMFGNAYSTMSWTTAGTPGVSLNLEPRRTDLLYTTSPTPLICRSKLPYGTSGQLGSPGGANGDCYYKISQLPQGGFSSLIGVGTVSTISASADQATQEVTLTRPVLINGQPRNKINISSNGWIATDTSYASLHINKTVPSASTTPVGVIAPFWDDLEGNGSAAGAAILYHQFLGADGVAGTVDDYTVVSWENWAHYDYTSNLNFQVKIYDLTGDIEFHYGAMSSTPAEVARGSEATIWIESSDGTYAAPLSINSATAPGIQPNTSYLFDL